MSRPSRSDEEITATSKATTYKFMCNRYPKEFTSGHALGGHQNAHRLEQIFIGRIAHIVEATRRHCLSIAMAKYLPVAARVGTGNVFDPATSVQPQVLGSKGGRRHGNLRIKKARHQCHPYARPVISDDEETMRRLLTKDLLNGVVGSPKRTITDPFVGNSKGKEGLDLDLKLGF